MTIRLVRVIDHQRRGQVGVVHGEQVVLLPYADLPEMLEDGAFEPADLLDAAESGRGEAVPLTGVPLGPPVAKPPKIVCIGLNYYDHASESGMQVPKQPILFSKYSTAIVGPGEPVVIPPVTKQVDYEVELGVVIGRRGKNIPLENALDYVFGYTICNDISARDLQFEDGQWLKGKTLDTFLPVGPAVVTSDEIPDPQALEISLERNGTVVQHASTKDMIFPVAEIVAYISRLMTLEPGDLIATGTPPGVILGQKDPLWLRPGEILRAKIEGIGELVNPVAEG